MISNAGCPSRENDSNTDCLSRDLIVTQAVPAATINISDKYKQI